MKLPPSPPNTIQSSMRLGLYIPLLLACGFVSGLLAVAFAQTNLPQQKDQSTQTSSAKKGTVRGRVIYEDTRRPLRRVQMMLYDPANRPPVHFSSWTNGRGEFQFK